MVLGTYANLYAMEESTNAKLAITNKPLGQINLPLNIINDDLHIIPDVPNSLELIPRAKGMMYEFTFTYFFFWSFYFLIFSYSVTDKINKPNINVLDKTLDLKAKDDVRQEPPIPVERVIVTEKQNVEKSDKAAVDTLVPEIKEVEVETIKTSNVNLNAQLQGAANTNVAKIDESVTLKAEEKIKMIEEKERSVDLQKNDNLINLDAIKKEESELAADGDVANAIAAERHEQLRKTLEKHKLEQRQMMQEQKKILKDIKEQKQEFEREKQRMAKDEMLKKSEKKIQINKENILPQSKTDLRENDERVVENKEINIEEENNKIALEEKQWNVVNEIKINEKQSQDKNIDIEAENGKKKLDSFQEISHNKDIEPLQKKVENLSDKSLFINNIIIDNEIPEKSFHKEKQDETKVERIEFNDSKSMKGPILNVLSKGALQKSIAEEILAKESDNRQIKEEKREALTNGVVNVSEEVQGKYDDKYSVPVALKMMNQSKQDKIIVSSNKSEPESLAVHRDILENNEREKRNVDEEVNVNDNLLTEKSESLIKDDVDRGTCSKQENFKNYEDKKFDKKIIKSSTTEVPLIKTNVYLSEQGITKTISMDVAFNVEYVSMKQRDLKVLNPKNNVEI